MADIEQLASTCEPWYKPHRVVANWPKGTTLVDLFDNAVETTDPNALAIVDGDIEITFGQLNEKVTILSKHLLAQGIGHGDPVGLSFERCHEYIIGYLAALRAQGAYMPIEEAWPAKQITNVLKDSRAKVVLTKSRNLHRFTGLNLDQEIHVFCMDAGWESNCESYDQVPEKVIGPRSRAYFVYTSGSTGNPKGIICPHEGAVMAYSQRNDLYPFGDDERFAANIFFTWECIRPIVRGRCCYIIPDSHIFDPVKLVKWYAEKRITRVMMTPSAFQNCIDLPELFEEHDMSNLRLLLFCGEVVTKTLLEAIERMLPQVKVVNFYSVSETHDTTYGECVSTNMTSNFSHAGHFVSDAEGIIVDEDLNVLPVNTPGELLIAGPSVCLEYLNLPEITAAKFFEWTYGDHPMMRVCRTGDRAKITEEGHLILLGRNSFMVKIRGYTVSLEATESKIKSLEEFNSVLVTAQGVDESHHKVLVAYVVLKDKSSVPIRKYVEEKLLEIMPFYCIPTHFVIVDALPLNNLGKVERKSKALPKWTECPPERMITNAQLIAQENLNPIQQQLADLWCEMLNVPFVSLDDDFTRIGGHSLLIVKMLREVQSLFGVEVSAQQFYNGNSSLKRLSALVNNDEESVEENFEYELAEDIQPSEAVSQGYPDITDIFITGTTGFVGPYLLQRLLESYTESNIHCLVRQKPEISSKDRIVGQLQRANLWKPEYDDRIFPVEGDLGKVNFGLSEEQFAALGNTVQLLVHCGKEVNLMKSAANLVNVNVRGTESILRLACMPQNFVTRVAYVSTLGVFELGKLGLTESSPISDERSLPNGYCQTSAMSERLVEEARRRGVPVQVFRLGQMSPALSDPCWNTVDFWFYFFQACLHLGTFPDLLDLSVEFTPVDYAANMMITLITSDEIWSASNPIFHIVNSNEILYKSIVSYMPNEPPVCGWSEWQKLLENPSLPRFCSMVHAMVAGEDLETWEYYTYQTFGCDYTQEVLVQQNFDQAPPEITSNLLSSWLEPFTEER